MKVGNIKTTFKKIYCASCANFEYAFYTAVSNNDSAKELMQMDRLRELAVVLIETIRQNAFITY